MHRIDSKYAVPELPEPAEAVTAPGYFQNGDEESETAGTVLDADWVNTVQEELVNVVEASGQQLEKGRRDQVLAGIKALIEDAPQITGAVAAAQAAADEAAEAKTIASEARALANEAEIESAGARAAAGRAEIKAEQAIQAATQYTGTYLNVGADFDPDEYYLEPGRYFVAESGGPLPAGSFVNVEVNADPDDPGRPLSVTQSRWHDAKSSPRRLGSVAWVDGRPSVSWSDWTETGGNSKRVGSIYESPFPINELEPGEYICTGDQYEISSPQGKALNGLSADYKAAWGISVAGDLISLPNLFDENGNGYFFRPVDGASRQVGGIQNHAVQDHAHNTPGWLHSGGGIFFGGSGGAMGISSGTPGMATGNRDEETRPINIGLLPVIYLGV